MENLKKLTDEEWIKRSEFLNNYWKSFVFDIIARKDAVIAEQKAEIERLTEERKTANMHDLMYWFNAYNECVEDCDKHVIEASDNKAECMRLQKQVDEQDKEIDRLEKVVHDQAEQYWDCKEQAVKDTAKEIFTKVDNAFSLYYPHGQIPYSAFQERLKCLAKENGVEVE